MESNQNLGVCGAQEYSLLMAAVNPPGDSIYQLRAVLRGISHGLAWRNGLTGEVCSGNLLCSRLRRPALMATVAIFKEIRSRSLPSRIHLVSTLRCNPELQSTSDLSARCLQLQSKCSDPPQYHRAHPVGPTFLHPKMHEAVFASIASTTAPSLIPRPLAAVPTG